MTYGWGVAAVLLAGLCGSTVGLFVRMIEQADGWQVLFYRSLSFATLVLLFMLIRDGRAAAGRFAGIGLKGAVVAICLGGAFIAYIFSVLLTTVASAVFILSASPFIAALLSMIFLRERPSTLAWVCMLAGLCGVGVMMADGLLGGTVLGSAVALIAATGYAASIVAFRAGKDIDMMPATCLAGVFAAGFSALMVQEFSVSGNDLAFAILLGTLQIGLQYILITIAARYVPAAEVTLLMLTEVIAAPLWVWLAFGETPAILVLAGGAVVLAAVAVQALSALRQQPEA
ncbi:MAG: DMT family transporter [Pseudomonadota bacterium]